MVKFLIKVLKILFGTGVFYLSARQLQNLAKRLLNSRYNLDWEDFSNLNLYSSSKLKKILNEHAKTKLEKYIFKLLLLIATTTIDAKIVTSIALLQSLGFFSEEIASYIYDASHYGLYNKYYGIVQEKMFDLTIQVPQCGEVINLAKDLLNHDDLPYAEKERMAELAIDFVLMTANGNNRSVAILCLISLIGWLALSSGEGFFVLLRALQRAYREGRISKELYQEILNQLRKAGISTYL